MEPNLERKEQRRYLKDIGIYVVLLLCFTSFSYVSVNVIGDLKTEVKKARADLAAAREPGRTKSVVVTHSDTLRSHDTTVITHTKVDTVVKRTVDTVFAQNEIMARFKRIVGILQDSISHLRAIISVDEREILALKESGKGKDPIQRHK